MTYINMLFPHFHSRFLLSVAAAAAVHRPSGFRSTKAFRVPFHLLAYLKHTRTVLWIKALRL